MGFFKRKREVRADTDKPEATTEESLVSALLGESEISISEALAIPDVQYCLDEIGGTIAGLPIRLYKKSENKVEEVQGDSRTRLLNNDTGDTLTATQFWKAMLEDYYFSKCGGFAYINKKQNTYLSLHYIDGTNISCMKNVDPVFKDYDVSIQGKAYLPYEFFKVMRKTKDGCTNRTLIDEANLLLSVAYYCYKFEDQLVKKGGSKKGFLKSPKKLAQPAMDALKAAYKNLYSNGQENVVVLNDGIDFQEAASTSVEMELTDHIRNNVNAIQKLFGVGEDSSFTKCVTRVIQDIECSLNRDLLLESEKDSYYFAFDTRKLIRGSIKERYEAYKIGLEGNFLQIDEVRKQEDLNSLGIDWITLGLDQVLYNPNTKECFTPNTKQQTILGDREKGGDENGSGS